MKTKNVTHAITGRSLVLGSALLTMMVSSAYGATLPLTGTGFTLQSGTNGGDKVYINQPVQGQDPQVLTGSIGSNDNNKEAYWSTSDAGGIVDGGGNGFATIQGNPVVHDVTFGVYDGYFGGLEFSLMPQIQQQSVFTITATFKNGLSETIDYQTGNGLEDFLVHVADSDNPFATITIQSSSGIWTAGNNQGQTTDGGFSQIKQWSVSGVQAVPIPAAVYLFGSALLGMAGIGYRRRNDLPAKPEAF
jgi:hypothetical protein